MDPAFRRVQQAARDASSNDDLVKDMWWDENDMPHPLDEETLDERYSTQMGPWTEVRRGADD